MWSFIAGWLVDILSSPVITCREAHKWPGAQSANL